HLHLAPQHRARRVRTVEHPPDEGIPKHKLLRLIKDPERQIKEASKNLEFERAAILRDQIVELRRAELSNVVDPTHDPLVSDGNGKDAVSVAEKVLAEQAAAVTTGRPRRRGRYRY